MIRAALLLLALALPAWAAPRAAPKAVPLDVSGDTVTYVRSFPCKITAAPGADFYLWSIPDAVKATSLDNVLTITAAPDGTHRISVVAVTVSIDFERKTKIVTKDAGQAEVNVGVPKPPEPDPPLPPSDPLVATLQKAYAAERDSAARDSLAAVWRVAGTTTALDPAVTTWRQLMSAVGAAGKSLAGDPATVLPATRKALAAHLAGLLPSDATALDAAGRKKASSEFARAAKALEALR